MTQQEIKQENTTLREELKELLDNPRTGLRESSDTNKTRQSILGMLDDLENEKNKALSAQLDRLGDEVKGMIRQVNRSQLLQLHHDDVVNHSYNNALDDIQSEISQEKLNIKE